MKRIMNHELRIMVLIALFIIHYSLFMSHTILATDSSPSADIQTKLEELKKQIASKAAKLKTEVNRKLKDKAYAGKVKSKSQTSLTLASHSGPRIVSINQDTLYESKIKGKGQTKFSFKILAEEDYVAALGDIDETGVLIAKKIVLLPEAKNETLKAYLWGQIISISDKLLTLKDKGLKNISVTVPDLSAVKLNDFVILTGGYNKNKIFSAEFVYVIRSTAPAAKISSPSAKPKATSR